MGVIANMLAEADPRTLIRKARQMGCGETLLLWAYWLNVEWWEVELDPERGDDGA